jgi:hypothetical protein
MGRLGYQGENLYLHVRLEGLDWACSIEGIFRGEASNLLMLANLIGRQLCLCRSIKQWGNERRWSIVVISHDREFCDQICFTHVGTVMNGCLKWNALFVIAIGMNMKSVLLTRSWHKGRK